jgi:hypothetical protein
MEKKIEKKFYWVLGFAAVLILLISAFPLTMNDPMHERDREKFISLKNDIQGDLLQNGHYRCCLEKPCTYCIEKSPGHGEGAICNCLEDLTNGVHPCGECIGEILEGHGNPYLSKYFANAIAEKVGEEHLDTLQEIVEDKYGTPIEEQYVF